MGDARLLVPLLILCALVGLSSIDMNQYKINTRRRLVREVSLINSSALSAPETGFSDDWLPSLETAGDHSWVLARVVGILSM